MRAHAFIVEHFRLPMRGDLGIDRTGASRAGRVTRGWAAVAGVTLLLLAVAMPARASSIVYLDQHDDIWMTSPDGAVKRQITTNGSAEGYSSPSMTDAGVIVAGAKKAFFFYFNRDGSSFGGPTGLVGLQGSVRLVQQPHRPGAVRDV